MSRRRRRGRPVERNIADIVDLASNARGVGHVDGKAVFVADTLPGERALYRPTRQKRDYEEAALETLHDQTEQIERINQDVHGFRGTVARSNKLIGIYRRRIMTDRLIWIFLFIIIAAIVGLVIWSLVDPEGSKDYVSVPEEAKPPTPEEIEKEFNGDRRLRGYYYRYGNNNGRKKLTSSTYF